MREFCKVLHAIAVYEYYLRHAERSDSNVVLNGFSLELCRLVEDSRTGQLRDQNRNLIAPLIGVDIVEDNSLFSIKIVNRTSYRVYPALFY